jgi:fibro-slime domain-containing protein
VIQSIAICLSVAALPGCSAAGGSGSNLDSTPAGPSVSSAGTGAGVVTTQPDLGSSGGGPALGMVPDEKMEDCQPVLQLTLRDFTPAHPDFEAYQGLNDIGCGMIASTLGSDTKPVFASAIGSKKRVVSGDWSALMFKSCDDWNGWNPAGVITSQASFDQWYRDVPGTNQTFTVPITLTDEGNGNFVYDSSAFFPLDGMGFGNPPGWMHNYSFTTEAHLKFGYVAGQKFTFRGDDDMWVFVNGKLALDLGGTHMPISATIDFDAQAADLGIMAGGTYQMDIFHAERHTDQSNFRVETNIRCFEPVKVK